MNARTKGPILVASLIVALVAAGTAVSGSHGDAQWRNALDARSQALNEQYGLGAQAPAAAGAATTPEASWTRALRLRSEALNQRHGLGAWKVQTSHAQLDEPAWLRALVIRSEALNRQYKLGHYQPRS